MKHGRHSEFLEDLKKRIDCSALNSVERMEFEGMMKNIVARSIALDVDSYTNEILINNLKELNPEIVNYETDLYRTQSKLADIEKDIIFHRKVISDLKEEYLVTSDRNLLELIDEREKAIKEGLRLTNQMMELRNKIRKEVDKKDVQGRMAKLAEDKAGANVIDINDMEM